MIIIIKSHCWHGFPWLFLVNRLYYLSHSTGLLVYILCPLRALVGMFFLVVQHGHIHVKGSIGERHWWFRSCFSSVHCPSYLDGFRDRRLVAVQLLFRGMLLKICLIQLVVFLCSIRLAFAECTSLASPWCIHTVELTQPLLGRNCI